MTPYLVLYILVAFIALGGRAQLQNNWLHPAPLGSWIVIFPLLVLMIGLRDQVGGDWFNYMRQMEYVADLSLREAILVGDPGYALFNWLGSRSSWGIYLVNLLSAVLFTAGLGLFCRSLPRPWLALVSAVPYMVIVVSMGYTRQGVALGLTMIGLVMLQRGRFTVFVFWILMAALFHKSAVVIMPIAALVSARNRFLVVLWILIASGLAYQFLLAEDVDAYVQNYVTAGYQSSGAFIRLAMNAVPAILFIIYRNRFNIDEKSKRLWLLFSIIALGLFAGFFVSASSTAIDRLALYIIPLQLFVFSFLPEVLGSKGKSNQGLALLVIAYYFAVLMVWILFADNAYSWIPYRISIY